MMKTMFGFSAPDAMPVLMPHQAMATAVRKCHLVFIIRS